MSFWSDAGEPLRKNRYLLNLMGTRVEAKTVTLPNFEAEPSEHRLMNHMVKFPGIGKWTDVNVTLVVTKKLKQSLWLWMTMYWDIVDRGGTLKKGTSTGGNLGTPVIQVLNESGKAVQTWELHGAFISSINYGDLDYSTDDFITVDLTISIDYAKIL